MSEENIPPDLEKHWKIRRYTMFVCIMLMVVFAIGFMVIGYISPQALSSMGVLIGWVFGTLSIAILGYYGNTGIEEFVKNRKQ